ncbi:MAG: allantoinase [Bacteroidetes bacterium RIFCSPLOWO2_02_FULL_36_8]|nr:MAG: allantoinase [Bacteroidetes bacterium RIFCSPLOWO2_02_FULL_36_8]OFY72246.1 MAG: allantoinase [Bacteroidetes bacterium RIFCSPLOWO2_12_FULL_37_12]
MLDDNIQPATIVYSKGKITSVIKGKPDITNIPVRDVGNSLIMPGLIDPHVHINEPGRTEWEGFETATRSAAAGGITTLMDMPLNSFPVTTTKAAFFKKIKATKKKLLVNCGFLGGLIPQNSPLQDEFLQCGIWGIKAFLTHSGIDEFPNVTSSDLRKALKKIADNGMTLLVHCEIAGRIKKNTIPENKYSSHLNSRPDSWELNAIRLMVKLCEEYRCRIHIVHLSSANALPVIRQAKEKGLPLTVETCPHYLCFGAEDIPDGDTRFKCAPPIRGWKNNERLWDALKEGLIDFIASDHSPAPPELKCLDTGNFKNAWGGITGLQTSLPAVWTEANRRGFSVTDVAKWMSKNPASFLGLGNSKGQIKTGFDADFVVWEPETKFVLEEKALFYKHKISPYCGKKLKGVVTNTIVGGQEVYCKGKFAKPKDGRLIVRVS